MQFKIKIKQKIMTVTVTKQNLLQVITGNLIVLQLTVQVHRKTSCNGSSFVRVSPLDQSSPQRLSGLYPRSMFEHGVLTRYGCLNLITTYLVFLLCRSSWRLQPPRQGVWTVLGGWNMHTIFITKRELIILFYLIENEIRESTIHG